MHNSKRMQGSVMPRPSIQEPKQQVPDINSTPSAEHRALVADTISVVDSVVLGYLGRALSFEWSFGQNCLTQAALAKSRGEMNYAQQFIDFANEEFQHANMLVDRIASAGMIPASSILQPSVATANTVSSLQSCWQLKNTQINLYLVAVKYCITHSFVEDNKLFNTLLQGEQEQLSKIQSLLASFNN